MKKIIIWISLVLVLAGGDVWAEFIDNGDGTVTDMATGLMWQQATGNDGSALTWEEAVVYCEALSLAGYEDWRLPNRNMLHGLVDYAQHSPSINVDVFPDTEPDIYWSSTTVKSSTEYAWEVYFYSGAVGAINKSGRGMFRAVRGGQ